MKFPVLQFFFWKFVGPRRPDNLFLGEGGVGEQDGSPTRQFTDTYFRDSSPTNWKTVHRHVWRQFTDTIVFGLMTSVWLNMPSDLWIIIYNNCYVDGKYEFQFFINATSYMEVDFHWVIFKVCAWEKSNAEFVCLCIYERRRNRISGNICLLSKFICFRLLFVCCFFFFFFFFLFFFFLFMMITSIVLRQEIFTKENYLLFNI